MDLISPARLQILLLSVGDIRDECFHRLAALVASCSILPLENIPPKQIGEKGDMRLLIIEILIF